MFDLGCHVMMPVFFYTVLLMVKEHQITDAKMTTPKEKSIKNIGGRIKLRMIYYRKHNIPLKPSALF